MARSTGARFELPGLRGGRVLPAEQVSESPEAISVFEIVEAALAAEPSAQADVNSVSESTSP